MNLIIPTKIRTMITKSTMEVSIVSFVKEIIPWVRSMSTSKTIRTVYLHHHWKKYKAIITKQKFKHFQELRLQMFFDQSLNQRNIMCNITQMISSLKKTSIKSKSLDHKLNVMKDFKIFQKK